MNGELSISWTMWTELSYEPSGMVERQPHHSCTKSFEEAISDTRISSWSINGLQNPARRIHPYSSWWIRPLDNDEQCYHRGWCTENNSIGAILLGPTLRSRLHQFCKRVIDSELKIMSAQNVSFILEWNLASKLFFE